MKIITLLFSFSLLIITPSVLAGGAVIVHPSNNIMLSDHDLDRLFLGKLKTFEHGAKAMVINLKFGHDVRTEFEQKILKKTSSQIKAYWSKRIFSGKGKPPKEVAAEHDIISLVAKNVDAIAYVEASSVTDAVKVIKHF